MKLYNNNKYVIYIYKNPVFYERTKHIEVDYQFLREKVQAGVINTQYINKWQLC